MKQTNLNNKYGNNSFENSNKTLFYVANFFEIILLIISAVASYHFYLSLFKELDFRETFAMILTTMQSIAIFFLFSYVWTQYFRKSNQHFIERFNGVFIIAVAVFCMGVYADLHGVEEVPEIYISEASRSNLDDLTKQYNNTQKDYKKELASLDKIIARTKNWNRLTEDEGKWGQYNKWKKATDLRADLLAKREANTIAYNTQRAKETDLFLLAKHKREEKVKQHQSSVRYIATICITLIVIIGFFKEQYQYGVYKERENNYKQPTGSQSDSRKVEDLSYVENQFKEVDLASEVERQLSNVNDSDLHIAQVITDNPNVSLNKIAKELNISRSKVQLINKQFNIRKHA